MTEENYKTMVDEMLARQQEELLEAEKLDALHITILNERHASEMDLLNGSKSEIDKLKNLHRRQLEYTISVNTASINWLLLKQRMERKELENKAAWPI